MSARRTTVSIGLPVYNGEAHLPAALASLLGQSHGDLELVISDNASTDGTRAICEDLAARDSRVRYYRNPTNLGVMANFLRAPQLATADYYMWAAHDDAWSPNYIDALLSQLLRSEDAVLGAGRTEYLTPSGEPAAQPPDHAPTRDHAGTEDVVSQLLRQHSTSWFYGIYRRAAIPSLLSILRGFPVWGGDLLFLLYCCLDYGVVGDEAAVIYKRTREHYAHAPKTPRQRTQWQLQFMTGLARVLARSRVPWQTKWALRHELEDYVARRVFYSGPRRLVRQWTKAALAVVRGEA